MIVLAIVAIMNAVVHPPALTVAASPTRTPPPAICFADAKRVPCPKAKLVPCLTGKDKVKHVETRCTSTRPKIVPAATRA
jgi:hypothetical protein